MAGKENLDRDLRDFQPPKKRQRPLVSLGLDSSAVLAMRKSRCCRKALCQRTLNRTMPGRCRCFRSGGNSEIGPFPTKRSNVQTMSMTLSFLLSRFVTEVRKQDGQPIYQVLSALQRKMVEQHPNARKFLNHKETIFSDIHRTCNSVYRELHSQGVAKPVFTAEEEKLYRYSFLRW